MSAYRIEQLEVCHREMFGDMVVTCQTSGRGVPTKKIVQPFPYPAAFRRSSSDSCMKTSIVENEKRRASALVDELLIDIYYNIHSGTTDYNSATSGKSHKNSWVQVVDLQEKDVAELTSILNCLRSHIERMGSVLVRQLKRRDALRRQREAYSDVITKQLAKHAPEGTEMRFSIEPAPGESGFSQWAAAMKMVAQLPGGIPPEFRRRLWLTLADRHLVSRGVDWPRVERSCFSEWSHPADAELGVQIVKDLHRTGCSLFCGKDGQENQALLKRVLLAYARWNKAVGYCQGFNMLAALILQVTDKCESDALKLMIYLIEGVLPDSYFADSLRGLSVDMAVFRELLRSRLPRLSKHLDTLQNAAKDGSRSYEPPLTNVFTMQWFLTLFCNCLPQPTVLRVWDLILLEGNEILLRTALAIWQVLAERILSVRSADEFYCIMGVLTRELLEFGLVDGNSLIKAVVAIGPLTELKTLRDHYLYNINPWGPSLPQAVVEKQLKLYSRQSIALDISALKKQYSKLKQRQRQAHIIFSAAISRHPPSTAPVTMNHLLLGKSALVPAKRLGPPKGAIPPARQTPSTLYWKDAPKQSSSSSSSDTELCDDESEGSSNEEEPDKSQFDNLPSDSDNILMKNDNTSVEPSAETLVVDPTLSQNSMTDNQGIGEPSDTFDTPAYNAKASSESDDENFDFERFLAERVRCLKDDSPDEESEERLSYARRNSTRALQIIQENSLILHRILQCQSRMSPSPPLVHPLDLLTGIDDTRALSPSSSQDLPLLNESVTFNSRIDEGHEIDTLENQSESNIESKNAVKETKSPEYGSKYTSILEKSKSLDERYNALILNIPPIKQSASQEENITKECAQKTNRDYSSSFSTGKDFFELFKYSSDIAQPIDVLSADYNKISCHSPEKSNIESNSPVSDSTKSYLDSISHYFPKEEEIAAAAQSIETTPTEDVTPTNPITYSHFSTAKTDTSDSAVSFLESFTSETNTSPVKSPKPSSTDLSNYKSGEESFKTQRYSLGYTLFEDNISSYNPLISEPYPSLIPSDEHPKDTFSCSSLKETPEKTSPGYSTKLEDKSPDEPNGKSLTLDLRGWRDSSTSRSPLKSPSKAFNPFPVPLSSRQSKEVPLKLGLYKK